MEILLLFVSVWVAICTLSTLVWRMRVAMAAIDRVNIAVTDAMLLNYENHKVYAAALTLILSNSIYIKTFCEEMSWRLVHFTDEELAALAEGEAVRQERIERERNNGDPAIERTNSASQSGGLGNDESVSLVRQRLGWEDVRDDTRHQVDYRRPKRIASRDRWREAG